MMNNYAVTGSAREFMYKVYGWMGTALAVSGGVAFYVASTPEIYVPILQSPILLFVIFGLQLGIVLVLGWKLAELSFAAVMMSYLVYSVLMGITLSTIFLVYTAESIHLTFLIAAGMFVAMALYGYFTNADLTSLGSICLMAMFGLIIAMLVNMWFRSPVFDYYISLAGVAIFTLLIAYDTQKIKQMGESLMADAQSRGKVSIMCALTLYLDFVNLFLFLLRLFGKKRD